MSGFSVRRRLGVASAGAVMLGVLLPAVLLPTAAAEAQPTAAVGHRHDDLGHRPSRS